LSNDNCVEDNGEHLSGLSCVVLRTTVVYSLHTHAHTHVQTQE